MSGDRFKTDEDLARLCEARESIVTNGPPAGTRQIDLRAPGGVDLRISPDRGFDITQAWWRGQPLAWTDASRENQPSPMLQGLDWIRSFSGGLLTTCGLRHIGAPNDGNGLHGRFSHQRAQVRAVGADTGGDGPYVSARAVVAEPDSFGPLVEVDRTIVTRAGMGHVSVTDVLTNRGPGPELLELLYHLNFRYRNDAVPSISVNDQPVTEEQFEAAKDTVELAVPDASELQVQLRDETPGVSATFMWDTNLFRHLYLWMYPTSANGGILAIEPATGPLLGDGTEGSSTLKVEPGERVHAGFTFSIRDLDLD